MSERFGPVRWLFPATWLTAGVLIPVPLEELTRHRIAWVSREPELDLQHRARGDDLFVLLRSECVNAPLDSLTSRNVRLLRRRLGPIPTAV